MTTDVEPIKKVSIVISKGSIEGIYPGRVVAFGVEDKEFGTQSLAVVAEMKGDFDEDAGLQLEAAIRKLGLKLVPARRPIEFLTVNKVQ